jgi:1,4-dihydroxy-2-naphthoate polyprenyltransferase
MLVAGVMALLFAIAWSLPMVAARGWAIVGIGTVSLALAYGYTGGPFPLAYRGMGEVFVFLFFGLLAVSGTVFVQTGLWLPKSLLAGAQIGALSTVLVAINNLRDLDEDTRSQKRTLAVRYGERAAKVMIVFWCLLPYALGCGWLAWGMSRLAWLPAVTLILGAQVAGLVFSEAPSPAYNRFLARSALHLILWTALFVIACLKDTRVF